jgi:hypothetical protein
MRRPTTEDARLSNERRRTGIQGRLSLPCGENRRSYRRGVLALASDRPAVDPRRDRARRWPRIGLQVSLENTLQRQSAAVRAGPQRHTSAACGFDPSRRRVWHLHRPPRRTGSPTETICGRRAYGTRARRLQRPRARPGPARSRSHRRRRHPPVRRRQDAARRLPRHAGVRAGRPSRSRLTVRRQCQRVPRRGTGVSRCGRLPGPAREGERFSERLSPDACCDLRVMGRRRVISAGAARSRAISHSGVPVRPQAAGPRWQAGQRAAPPTRRRRPRRSSRSRAAANNAPRGAHTATARPADR